MATIYVDSNATGANNGTSFTDAFTSMSSVIPSSGDIVLTASDHSETASITYGSATNDSDWVSYISVDSTTEAYETGATILSVGDQTVQNARIFGFTIDCQSTRDLTAPNDRRAYFKDCTIDFDRFLPSGTAKFEDCVTSSRSSSIPIQMQGDLVEIVGGSFSAGSAGVGDALVFVADGIVNFFGVDLNGNGAEFLVEAQGDDGVGTVVRFVGCRLPASQAIINTASPGTIRAELVNCISGTDTDPIIDFFYEDEKGTCDLDTAVTRTGGASDGTTFYAMALKAKANHTKKSIEPAVSGYTPISIWVDEADTNIRLYLAHNGVGSGTAGALQDNECWMTYQGPSEAVPANAHLEYKDTRAEFGVTPTDLAADGSAWSGAGVGTEQRIDLTIAPTESGYAHLWVSFAPESGSDQTIHFDPKIDVT